MNSLEDLNNYGNTQVEYQDDRAPSITFFPEVAVNQAVQIYQSSDHIIPVGTDIVEIINYDSVAATYTIDLTAAQPGSKAVWDPVKIPAHVTIAEVSTRIFRVSGLKSAVDWEAIKNPTIQMPETQGTDVTYTAYITYNGSTVNQWTVAVDVIPFDVLSYPSNFIFANNVLEQVTGQPRLYDSTINSIVWTVKIVPSNHTVVDTMSSSGTGGTSTFDNLAKELTITGTREQVNSHLENLFFKSVLNAQQDITLSYRATNNTDSRDITRTQNLVCENILYLGPNGGGIMYNEDVSFTLTNYPLITDPLSAGTGTYTLTITAVPTTAVRTMSNTGAGGSSSFDNALKRLTITGTRTQINNRIGNTVINPQGDYTSEFALVYSLTTPTAKINSNTQGVYLWTQHDEVSNISTARRYDNDTPNIIFSSNIPQITDLDESNPNYTITLTSPIGKFGATAATAVDNFTYTGSKTQINSLLTSLVFVPNLNQTGNSTFNYTQTKAGLAQVTQNNIILNGPWIAVYPKVPVTQNISGTEGGVLTLTPGTNIIATNSPPTAATLTINVSSIPGATVNWSSVPAGSTVTNPSAGVYTINNINTVAKWETVKAPQIRLPNAYFGTASFTSTLTYPLPSGTTSVSWTTFATIANQEVFSTFTKTCPYFPGNNSALADYLPRIVDDGNQTPTWTVVLTPSEASNVSTWNYSTSGGGTVSVNATTKVATITGTKTQINAILASFGFTPNPIQDFEFKLTMTASNNLNTETDTDSGDFYSIRETILKMTRTSFPYYGSYTGEVLANGYLVHTYYCPEITGGPLISTDPTDAYYSAYMYTNRESEVEVIATPGYIVSSESTPYYDQSSGNTAININGDTIENPYHWGDTQVVYSSSNNFTMPQIKLSGDGGTYIINKGSLGYEISYCNSAERWQSDLMKYAGFSSSPNPTLTPSPGTNIRQSAINYNGTRAALGYDNNTWFIERNSPSASGWTQMTYSTVAGIIQDMDDAGNTALISGKVMVRDGSGNWTNTATLTFPTGTYTSARLSGNGQYAILQAYSTSNYCSVGVWKRNGDNTWTNTYTINNVAHGTTKGADINYDGTRIVTSRGLSPNNQYCKVHNLTNGVVTSSEEIWYPRDFFGRITQTWGDVAISSDGNTIICSGDPDAERVTRGIQSSPSYSQFIEFRRAKVSGKWFMTPTYKYTSYFGNTSGTMEMSKNGRAFAYVQYTDGSTPTRSVAIERRTGRCYYYDSTGKFRVDGTKNEVNTAMDGYVVMVTSDTVSGPMIMNFDVTLGDGTRSIRRQTLGKRWNDIS